MVTGVLIADLLLGDVHSLKEKRSVIRPILAALRRFEVSAAETGHLDLHRRAELSVALVAPESGHAVAVLERCERLFDDYPELTLLSIRQRIIADGDLD
jgi:uncharacterized protein YlxP (DUF503 family)